MNNSLMKTIRKVSNGILTVFLYFLFSTLIISSNCKRMNTLSEDKTVWKATISAPVDAPIEIVKGELIASDYTYYFDPIWGTVHPGWGTGSGNLGESQQVHSAPNKLKLLWYSHNDRAFYQGSWDIQSPELKNKFAKSYQYWDANREENVSTKHNLFVIGLGPDGLVNLWFGGDNDQYLVGSYKGTVTNVSKEDLPENAQYLFNPQFIESVNSSMVNNNKVNEFVLTNGNTDRKLLEDFNQVHSWRIQLQEGDKVIGNSKIERLKLVNGEEAGDLSKLIVQLKEDALAALYFLLLNYTSDDGSKYVVRVEMIPSEVNQIMKELGKGGEAILLDIQIENLSPSGINVEFKKGDQSRTPKEVKSRLTKLVN